MTRSLLDPQPWEWAGPRVLLEDADTPRADVMSDALRRAGYAVAICAGPAPDERCPLAGGNGCAAALGADVVVSSLGFETAAARAVLRALRTSAPRLPLVVVADGADVVSWPDLVDGCSLAVPAASAPEQVVELVHATLEREEPDVA